MKTIIETIIKDVLVALYQPFWFAVLLSFCFMYVYLVANKKIETGVGWKKTAKLWIQNFRIDNYFRKAFLWVFYSTMILFRTLVNRNMWANPLSDIFGNWWIYTVNPTTGESTLSTECFENLALFIPFSFLMLWNIAEKYKVASNLLSTIRFSGIVCFLISLSIEFLQLFLRLGNFQLSDLFYNTAGGIVGGIVYYFCIQRNVRKKADCKEEIHS